MNSWTRVSLAASMTALLACGGSPGPVAGVLKVRLTDPNNGQDGAVQLLLSAPVPPVSVTAGPGLTLWGGPMTTASARLVLTGTVTTGTLLPLQVDDVNAVQQYSVALQQMARTADFQLDSLSGYAVTVVK